jgi:putative phage-type endonuclease
MRTTELAIHPAVASLLRGPQGLPQRSQAWLDARENLITASEVASALGENKYQTLKAYVKQKAGHTPRFKGNAATRWGTLLEPTAQALYEKQTGRKLIEMGLVPHPRHSILAGSPDGITLCGRLVEIKCPPKRPIGDGSVPQHYMPQIQLLLDILNLDVCDFVQYKPEPFEFVITEVHRQPGWLDARMPTLLDVHRQIRELAAQPKPLDLDFGTPQESDPDHPPLPMDVCLIVE